MKVFKRMSFYLLALVATIACTGVLAVAATAEETENYSADVRYVIDRWQAAVDEYNAAHDESLDHITMEYVEGEGLNFTRVNGTDNLDAWVVPDIIVKADVLTYEDNLLEFTIPRRDATGAYAANFTAFKIYDPSTTNSFQPYLNANTGWTLRFLQLDKYQKNVGAYTNDRNVYGELLYKTVTGNGIDMKASYNTKYVYSLQYDAAQNALFVGDTGLDEGESRLLRMLGTEPANYDQYTDPFTNTQYTAGTVASGASEYYIKDFGEGMRIGVDFATMKGAATKKTLVMTISSFAGLDLTDPASTAKTVFEATPNESCYIDTQASALTAGYTSIITGQTTELDGTINVYRGNEQVASAVEDYTFASVGNYRIEYLSADGEKIGEKQVAVTLDPSDPATVTLNGVNVSIVVGEQEVANGGSTTVTDAFVFSVNSTENYYAESVTFNGKPVAAETDGSYAIALEDIQKDNTVAVITKGYVTTKFSVNGNVEETYTKQLKQGEKVVFPSVAPAVGYRFQQWLNEDKAPVSDVENCVVGTQDGAPATVTFTAEFALRNYTIKYSYSPEEACAPIADRSETIESTADLTAGISVNDGYVLEGLYFEGTKVESVQEAITASGGESDVVTLIVRFVRQHTVTLYNGTEKIGEIIVQDGGFVLEETCAEKLTVPAGFELEGWYTDAGCTQKYRFGEDNVVEDMSLYANLVEKTESGEPGGDVTPGGDEGESGEENTPGNDSGDKGCSGDIGGLSGVLGVAAVVIAAFACIVVSKRKER